MSFFRAKKREREPMRVKEPPWYRSNRHRSHVRKHECAIKGKKGHVCEGIIECAHDRYQTDGATGVKPSDFNCWPACSKAHDEQHKISEPKFERKYGIVIKDWTAEMVRTSPCRDEIADWKKRHPQEGTRK